ncbi:DUF2306 domain-containing protein [Sphaerisporangium fuscum]|uniref:DUF2306 domain-containing protein n=1 Tax=Sphaerisporangium fuscum TaxID=2835868 RepID=UPI0020299B40|nr:DUF2306 domain-containing protein [Sphaerisporangium fuscum]
MTDESMTMEKARPHGRSADVRKRSGAGRDRLVVAGLIALSAVPVIAGSARLTQLAGGAQVTADNARFFASPVSVVLHIIAVTLYSVLGAFQFAPRLRRRKLGLHRAAGRLLVLCGLVAALSGLWMTLFYPRPALDGDLLEAFRLVFGSAMALSVVLGFAAIMRRDVARHRAWMIRAYAIGLGAGTQVLTHGFWYLVLAATGRPASLDELSRAMLMLAGWVINVAVAEWLIRRVRS